MEINNRDNKGGKMNRPDWDTYFMLVVKMIASRSTCLSRQLGVVIVGLDGSTKNQILSTGYVGALPGLPSCYDIGQCYYRSNNLPKSSCKSSHAESNAINQAAKAGISIYNTKIYTMLYPCYKCAKQIVMAGIKQVIYSGEHLVLEEMDKNVYELFRGSGIICRQIDINYSEWVPFLIKESEKRQLPEISNLVEQGKNNGHT